ncbi:LysR family transcriptional regulator [Ramlibacter henchirensis]|uniref:LysR family transcriptional regulator n=1 Tax=Ramlibacter henchirensis TaxID=204072 RepID=A0A4Z0BVB7_9BURK|nr:LysR family transcriptional regulator [Ramlibacter henchirensis]TFZ02652.1 LysR family transcriptional regulator [Ramlibacter henchirensis]
MGSVDRQHSTPQLLNRLRMRQIALLLALDELGTLRAAAEHLGLTQPAATKMLHELETALGQRLFERVGRGLQRNAAGDRVIAHFQSIRGSMEALNRELGEIRAGGIGKLTIGSIMAASPGRLTHALLRLKQEMPMLAVEVAVDTSDRLLAQLDEGVLDLVIGRMTGTVNLPCRFRAIDDEALALIAANDHPLARRRKLDLPALLDYPWVLQPPGSPMRDLIEREFRENELRLPRGLIETGSILTTINLVRDSQFLAVVPQAVALGDAQHGKVRVLPYRFARTLESYGSIVPEERPPSRAALRFLELLHEAR